LTAIKKSNIIKSVKKEPLKGLFFKPFMLGKIKAYVNSSVEEMKKVTWPTKKETTNYTLMVIGLSLAMAAFLGGFDYFFTWLFESILK